MEWARWVTRTLNRIGVRVGRLERYKTMLVASLDMLNMGNGVMRFTHVKKPWDINDPHVLVNPWVIGEGKRRRFIGATIEWRCHRTTPGQGEPRYAHRRECNCMACQFGKRILRVFTKWQQEVTDGKTTQDSSQ